MRLIDVNEAFTVTSMKTSKKVGHKNEGRFKETIVPKVQNINNSQDTLAPSIEL